MDTSAGAAELVGNLLVGLLIIGIGRAWELVGDRATGIIASIAVLTGHDATQMAPPAFLRPEPIETDALARVDSGRDGAVPVPAGSAGRSL